MGERFSSNSSFIRDDVQATITIRRESKACLDIVGGQVREIIKDLHHRHTATEVIKNIRHSNPCAANTGFPAADKGVDSDAITVVHGSSVLEGGSKCKPRETHHPS